MNNTAKTVEHSLNPTIGLGTDSANYISSPNNENYEDKEINKVLNQVGEAVKKIAIGGTNVLSNISGEIKKGLQ